MTSLTLADFERGALETLMSYAAIPCLSPAFDAQWRENGHLERAIELLAHWARSRPLRDAEVTIHRLEGRTPVLTITVAATEPSDSTVVLYGHLDKQPPLGTWSEGLGPFAPVRREDRLFARGVADDGYAIFSAVMALEALEASGTPHSRCVVLIEASEESGSPDLEAYLDALADHLGQVKLLICLDSGAMSYDRLWVTTSLRGILNVEVKVSVLSRGQHSGSASGVAPSSFRILRQLLDRIEDAATGEVRLAALHAPIPDDHVQAARAVANEFGDVLARELPTVEGLELMGVSAEDRLLRRTWAPALSLVGMGGIPSPNDAGNVLRPSTTAVLSLRLPPTVAAPVAFRALEEALTTNVPSSAHVQLGAPSQGDGWVAPPLAPWLRDALNQASMSAFGREAGFAGEGGSIPFLSSLGKRYPSVQFVATGVLGPASNAHGIDEMLDLPMAVGVTNAVINLLGAFVRQEKVLL